MGYHRKQGDKAKHRNPFGMLKATGEYRRGELRHRDRRVDRNALDKSDLDDLRNELNELEKDDDGIL